VLISIIPSLISRINKGKTKSFSAIRHQHINGLKFSVSLSRTSLSVISINAIKPRVKYQQLLTNNIDVVVADELAGNITRKPLGENKAVDMEMSTAIQEATEKIIRKGDNIGIASIIKGTRET
jgi:ABC-type amino acid transport substrate-binding protein